MEQLSNQQIDQFISLGYVKIEHAFPTEIAAACRAILWQAMQLRPDQPEAWVEPVVWLGEMSAEPFRQAANTPVLLNAFEQLASDNWLPRTSLGSFPIRFPSPKIVHDTGWHVDASFPGDDATNYFEWRINIQSRGRALLMLFLFSDVSEQDAPTRIREGSHWDVAKLLEPAGEAGLTFMELAQLLEGLPDRPETTATGSAGTVYLCHPFLIHAAQQHRGTMPKFMAQPPLLAKHDFDLTQPFTSSCPVAQAIIKGRVRGE